MTKITKSFLQTLTLFSFIFTFIALFVTFPEGLHAALLIKNHPLPFIGLFFFGWLLSTLFE